MKRIVVLFILAFCFSAGMMNAQDKVRSRSVYGELFGASQGIGVNYDARFNPMAKDGLGWRAGLGVGATYSSNGIYSSLTNKVFDLMVRFSAPVELNYLVGKGSSQFESGLGIMPVMDIYHYEDYRYEETETEFSAFPYFSLGYRLVIKGGFLFRTGLVTAYNFPDETLGLCPYFGFGWAF